MKARKGITVVELLMGIAIVVGLVWWYVARESARREQARVAIQEQQERTDDGPKLKRFRQTVVMYDGTHIKKDMNGVTYVPRVFRQFGTSEYGTKRAQTVEDFRRQWESLRVEAERQERKAQEIARENQERKERFQNEQERARGALEITDSKARGEIDSYLVFIERGRGR